VAVVLRYPPARATEGVGDPAPDANASLTARPHRARSGRVAFLVDGRRITVSARPGGRFQVPASAGDQVRIAAGAARDRFGNRNGEAFAFTA
jgi:hypothetical protein